MERGSACRGPHDAVFLRARVAVDRRSGFRCSANLAVKGASAQCVRSADLRARVRDLPRPRRQGLAAKRRRLRAAAAERPRRFPTSPTARQHGRAARPTGWRWPSAAAPSAGSTVTCRPSATRSPTSRSSAAVKHLWRFCSDPAWPRGDLNFPRAFFTEKAFPENETVWTTGDHRLWRQGGDEPARLRASHRRARAVRSDGAVRLPARRGRRQLEPAGSATSSSRCAARSMPASIAAASSPPAGP